MDTTRVRVRAIPLRQFPSSSAIEAAGYDADRGILRVQFAKPKNAPPYDYPNVTQEQYDGLLKAKSKGRYFYLHIDRRGDRQVAA
jgi:hypothetical protein